MILTSYIQKAISQVWHPEPNIGLTLAEKLKMVGISMPGDLIITGSGNGIIKIKTIDKDACINMLFALEGATNVYSLNRKAEISKLKRQQENDSNGNSRKA